MDSIPIQFGPIGLGEPQSDKDWGFEDSGVGIVWYREIVETPARWCMQYGVLIGPSMLSRIKTGPPDSKAAAIVGIGSNPRDSKAELVLSASQINKNPNFEAINRIQIESVATSTS